MLSTISYQTKIICRLKKLDVFYYYIAFLGFRQLKTLNLPEARPLDSRNPSSSPRQTFPRIPVGVFNFFVFYLFPSAPKLLNKSHSHNKTSHNFFHPANYKLKPNKNTKSLFSSNNLPLYTTRALRFLPDRLHCDIAREIYISPRLLPLARTSSDHRLLRFLGSNYRASRRRRRLHESSSTAEIIIHLGT